MALPLPPTLSEVRQSVAVRLNFGTAAIQSAEQVALLDEWIRRAAREIELEAAWLHLKVEERVDLIADQTVYDIPDGFDLGALDEVGIVAVNDDGDESFYPLANELRDYERTEYGQAEASLPLRMEVIDQQITILPKPDVERYPYLYVRGRKRVSPPRHHSDRIPLDAEALIQWTTAIGKAHLQHPDAMVTLDQARRYAERLRPRSTVPGSVRLGGHHSTKYNRSRRGVRNYTDIDDWHPRP